MRWLTEFLKSRFLTWTSCSWVSNSRLQFSQSQLVSYTSSSCWLPWEPGETPTKQALSERHIRNAQTNTSRLSSAWADTTADNDGPKRKQVRTKRKHVHESLTTALNGSWKTSARLTQHENTTASTTDAKIAVQSSRRKSGVGDWKCYAADITQLQCGFFDITQLECGFFDITQLVCGFFDITQLNACGFFVIWKQLKIPCRLGKLLFTNSPIAFMLLWLFLLLLLLLWEGVCE